MITHVTNKVIINYICVYIYIYIYKYMKFEQNFK